MQFLEQKGRYEPEELPEELPDPGISVEETVIGRISSDKLMEFLHSLPEAQKQAIILKSVYGLNYREIADILGITEAAVRRRISDAYVRIRGYIKDLQIKVKGFSEDFIKLSQKQNGHSKSAAEKDFFSDSKMVMFCEKSS